MQLFSCANIFVFFCRVIMMGSGTSPTNQITLYPNPASGYVSINVPDNLPSLELTLTDLTGFVIKQIKYKGEMDVSLLAQGVYIYTVKKGHQILKTGKLLINR